MDYYGQNKKLIEELRIVRHLRFNKGMTFEKIKEVVDNPIDPSKLEDIMSK